MSEVIIAFLSGPSLLTALLLLGKDQKHRRHVCLHISIMIGSMHSIKKCEVIFMNVDLVYKLLGVNNGLIENEYWATKENTGIMKLNILISIKQWCCQ